MLEAIMFAFVKNGKLLVEHRLEKNPPEPFIPNGKIEERDKASDLDYRESALRREIREEFGEEIVPKKVEYLGEYEVEAINVIFYIYLINSWEGEIGTESYEEGKVNANLEWMNLEDANKIFAYPILHHVVDILKGKI